MNDNIKVLLTVCRRLGVPHRVLHPDGNLVAVETPVCDRIFANWSTPLNDQSISRLCRDKDYSYQALSSLMPMPKTQAFLNPDIAPQYQRYVRWSSIAAIVAHIEQTFTYPLIIKPNQGSLGRNVLRANDPQTLTAALTQIFNSQSSDYDYVALVQDYIDIAAEYRAIFLQGTLILAYLKDTSTAQATDNLSPFRWDGTRARLETDPQQLHQLHQRVSPGLQKFNITYTGVDIAIDTAGDYWVLELNASPGFSHLVRDGGQPALETLYEKMLDILMKA